MIDKILVEKKLRKIEELLRELNSVEVKNFQEFKKNFVIKRFIERNIELSIEQMVDVCKHLISGLDLKEPETYAECFDILCECKIIPEENLDDFKKMVRFRNILIHSYDKVDDTITFSVFKKDIGDFRMFINVIRDNIKR